MNIKTANEKLLLLKQNLKKVMMGVDDSLDLLIISLGAEGSVLMEDVPGTGKTTLAKTLAKSIDSKFNRIQFTPDLLPADILGSSIYNPIDGNFKFREGPIFGNIILTDEINRASPRTQSALLEAMSEKQATIEGVQYKLPNPFFIIATQNPVEYHGTYPLPEAQLDRFISIVNLGYPAMEIEEEILNSQINKHPLEDIESVLTGQDIVEIQETVKTVKIDPSITKYILKIVDETRNEPRLKLGVSPRGSLMLLRATQSMALLNGREFCLPDDVQYLAPHILSHRIVLTTKAKYGGMSKRELIKELVSKVNVPK